MASTMKFSDPLNPAVIGGTQLDAQESESGERQGLVVGTRRAAE